MAMFDLKGRVAVVTGGASGIGASAAKAYAEHGADVALLDITAGEMIEAVAEEIRGMGKKALVVACDVSNNDSVKKAVGEVESAFGRIDILLNNAGIAIRGTVDTLSEEDWDRVLDINTKGIYLMSKYVVPIMIKQNYGKIVNISSVNSILGEKTPDLSRHAYNASKAAVRGLSLGMACTYMQNGITVNTICPGLFKTGMTENTLFKHEAFLNRYNTLCPASRPAEIDEINGTILYFSSDATSYVTGQYITVDGGLSLV